MKGRWAVFLSGRGSTAQALFDQIDQVDVRLVISNRSSAYGLKRAARLGIPTLTLAKDFAWSDVDQELRRRQIDRLFLLGFMKLIPADFIKAWTGRIWNVHPSLLPSYPGIKSLEKSHAERADMGVTIHDVTFEMDAGQKRLQHRVFSGPEASLVSLAEAQLRMAVTEQRLIRDWSARATSLLSHGGLQ